MAMLRSLEIQNFKGIKQGKLEDLAQVNILVGRNNSGKSTVLDALVVMRCALMRKDYLGVDGFEQVFNRRVERGPQGINYDELWYRMDTAEPLGINLSYGGDAQIRQQWSSRGGTNIPSGVIIARQFETGVRRENISVAPGDERSPSDFRNHRNWQLATSQYGEANAHRMALIHLLTPNMIHSPFNEAFWYELAKDRTEKKVIEILNRIYGLDIEQLEFTLFPPPIRRLVARFPNSSAAIDWLGDGFRYAVNILSFGVFLRGTALLVEELETHQHPESLRMLTGTLIELAKQQDLQLFLTTHSMELITYALEAAEKKEIDLKLHHLSLSQEGTLRSIPFTRPNAELMLDIGHDPRLHYKYIGA